MTVNNVQSSIIEAALSKIKRDTKREDLEKDAIALIFFDKYNTTVDKDGKTDNVLDDNEWSAFENYIKTVKKRIEECAKVKANNAAIKLFEKRIKKSEKKLEEVRIQAQELSKNNCFEQLCDYETQLQTKYKDCTLLKSYTSKKEIKEAKKRGAIVRNIESFGRALTIDENKKYSGIEEEVYIEFPPEMNKEEQDKFMSLLDKAIEETKKSKKLAETEQAETKNIEKNIGLINSILIGKMREIGSDDLQNSVYEKWQSNNFLHQRIEELERQRNEIWLKSEKTEADNAMLRQIDNMLKDLYNASYSEIYAFNNGENGGNESEPYGLSATYKETVNYADRDNQTNSHVLTDSHLLEMSYKIPDWKFGLNGTKTEQYITEYGNYEQGQEKPDKFQNQYILNPSIEFQRNKFTSSLNMNFNIRPESLYQEHTFTGKYNNTELTVREEINTVKMKMPNANGEMEEQKNTTYGTTVELSQQLGRFNTSASLNWSDDQHARTYNTSTRYSFDKQSNNGKWNFSANPSVGVSYIDTWDESDNKCRVQAGFNGNLRYNSGKLSAGLNINDNASQIITKGSHPVKSNYGNATLSANYNKIGISAGYTNQVSDSETYFSRMNQGDFALSYSTPAGNIEGRYSISRSDSKCGEMNMQRNYTNSFVFTFTTTLEKMKNLFSKKAKKSDVD